MLTSLDETRWRSRQDKAARSDFVIAIKTTKIYCRPGCPARGALRKNVIFYDTVEPARAAGFRACKRCHPDV